MPSDHPVSTTPKYLIGIVTKLTGLSIDVVRVWERRYGAVRPARSDGGTRLYSDADVLRLTRLRKAVEKGHSIGQAAKLSESELDELIALGRPSLDRTDPYRTVRERFIEAVQTMDVVAANQELARAANLFPTREFVKKIAAPMVNDLNERWAQQECGAAHEHLASGLLRGMLGSLLRLYPPSGTLDTLVLATTAGERRDPGLLLAALLAATHGWRVVNLGADLRAAEIAYAVRLTAARVLVLDLTSEDARSGLELEAISSLVSSSTRVWIGGVGAIKHKGLLDRANWILLHDLDELDDRLRR
jgi:MerR family transcriptional regulator, light-induced transcriptional regulator